MLDKSSVLNALTSAEKETVSFTHQNMGKTDLISKLIAAINNGNFDAKENDNNQSDIVEVV